MKVLILCLMDPRPVKSEMDWTVTLLLLCFGCSLNSCSHSPLRQYHYINQPMTWTEAQQHCREKYTDLATFENMDDISRLNPPEFSYSLAWIGLNDDPKSWKESLGSDANSWRWSATGETSKTGYQAWVMPEPDNYNGREQCVVMKNDKWSDNSCDQNHRFVCYDVINQTQKIYKFIDMTVSWSAAQQYCRDHHTDLVTINNSEENTQVRAVSSTYFVWIGLYREPWKWSDMSQSSYRKWMIGEPNNSDGNCVAESPGHEWVDAGCGETFPFICHQVVKQKIVVRLKLKSGADLTDSAVNEQILQQVAAMLRSRGITDAKVQWKTPPKKKEPGSDP